MIAPDSQSVRFVFGSTIAMIGEVSHVSIFEQSQEIQNWTSNATSLLTRDPSIRIDIDKRLLLHIIELERLDLIWDSKFLQDTNNLWQFFESILAPRTKSDYVEV